MENIDTKKIIEIMDQLKARRAGEIAAINEQNGIQSDETKLLEQINVEYLGEIEVNENSKSVKKHIIKVTDEISGLPQARYYDEEQQLLGVQIGLEGDMMLSSSLSSKPESEQGDISNQLAVAAKREGKTKEQLQEEQKEQGQTNLEEIQPEYSKQTSEEPQLTPEELNSLTGPKISLNQIVDEDTLGNVVGSSGEYIKFVDADIARKKGIDVLPGQRTVPVDDQGKFIGNDRLAYSNIEGTNSTQENVTMTNEGTVRSEQNLDTFNIVSKGGMHTIGVGYDENGGMPLDAKYGRRDIEDPTKIAYTELEKVNEGPMKQDDVTQLHQRKATGVYKGQEAIDAVVEKYARAMNIREVDQNGNLLGYDLEKAKELLEQQMAENPGATLEEIIEDQAHVPGPTQDRRW